VPTLFADIFFFQWFHLLVAATAVMIGSLSGDANADLSAGQDLYAQGNYADARPMLQRALERNPLSPAVQLAYARVIVNGDSAVNLYRKVAENSTAHDTLRAEAMMKLGHSRLLLGDRTGAASWFRKVGELHPDSHSIVVLHAIEGLPRATADRIAKALPGTHPEKMTAFSNGPQYYALQVGSFAVLDNAKKSVARFKPDFPATGIRPVVVDGTSLYRVRIGTFENENSAVSFGMEHLRPKQISFRAVKDSIPAVPADSLR
jgi:tetratricopeptide (TPR) repeat protein